MKSFEITKRIEGQKLLSFVKKCIPEAQNSLIYKSLRKKNIVLNGKKASGNEVLKDGDTVNIYFSDETFIKLGGKEDINYKAEFDNDGHMPDRYNNGNSSIKQPNSSIKDYIIYEDDDIIAVNKPKDMLSQKAGKDDYTLTEMINDYIQNPKEESVIFKAGICNRLDRNTSGIVIAGKSIYGLQSMNNSFKERMIDKYYLCVVAGEFAESVIATGYLYKDTSHNTVTVRKERHSEADKYIKTGFRPLKVASYKGKPYTLLEVKLFTGKSHQIRAHLKSLGYVIIGDSKYGKKEIYNRFKKDFKLKSQFLHAYKLVFKDSDEVDERYRGVVLTAPLPESLSSILSAIGLETNL